MKPRQPRWDLLGLCLLFAALSLLWPVPPEQTPGPIPAPGTDDNFSPDQLQLHWVRELLPQQPAWPDQPLFQIDAAAQPVVHGQTVYLASARTDSVAAYDADTGNELWSFTSNGPIRFAPAVWRDRLYFGSDDGYLYCLESDTGRLVWKVRGGPSDRLILGNSRLISTWPVRGAPAVVDEPASSDREGTVYFAAGIWPFMGVFLHALDARSGQVVWTNDGEGSVYRKQPHVTDAFAGIAPQGPLVVSGDRLLVPGGRSIPACYDRHSGQLVHYRLAENSKKGGGPSVAVQDRLFINGPGVFEVETGRYVGAGGTNTVGRAGLFYAWTGSECRTLAAKEEAAQTGRASFTLTPLVRTTGPKIEALLLAGNYLLAGEEGLVLAYNLPMPQGQAVPAWRSAIEGRPVHLAVGGDRLLVATREGRLYCFGEGQRTVVRHGPLQRAGSVSDGSAFPVANASGLFTYPARLPTAPGYAVVWGVGSGQLVEELLARTQLNLIVIEPSEERAQTLRQRLIAARTYGTRAAVLTADCNTIQLPPYLASLMTSEDLFEAGVVPGPEFMQRVFTSLRPYGGVACLPLPEEKRPDLSSFATLSADTAQAKMQSDGDWVLMTREGPLPGSANWTHEHADAGNSRVSRDQRVKAPLGLLWFGGTSNEGVLPRHGHGPQPQVVDGRLIIEGVGSLRAVDVYTGLLLWETKLPGLGRTYDNLAHQPGANASGTNYVSLSDGIYVVRDNHCLRLDPATGKEMKRLPLPRLPGVKGQLLWSYLNVCDDYLIGLANPPPTDSKARSKALSSSQYLFVLNRHDGRLLWSRTAKQGFRHNTLIAGGGRLHVIDRDSGDFRLLFKRKADPKAPAARLLALRLNTGKEIWSSGSEVFGTWLAYSAKHDVLIESGRVARDTLSDEPKGMRAYRAGTGQVLWYQKDYAGPAMIHGDRVLKDNGACDLMTGHPYRRPDPLTGELVEWTWARNYGCNTPMASEHLLTFRSGAAGFYDLCNEGGTGNLGGFRSGCTNNLVVAGGVLTAPDYTRTCTCSYQNQTSLALVPTPEAEMWTFQGKTQEVKGVVRRAGLLLGAPGNRKADNGTLWLEYPPVGGPSPRLTVKVEPAGVTWFRRHSSQVEGAGPTWQAASGAKGVRSLTLTLAGANDKPRSYVVRLVFIEPESRLAGERVFDVSLQGQTVYSGLDVSAEAGGPNRMLVIGVRGGQGRPDADAGADADCGVRGGRAGAVWGRGGCGVTDRAKGNRARGEKRQMWFLDIFKKGEDPLPRYEDDFLGPMSWSEDDEAWAGEYGGIRYLIAYERGATPTSEALAHARMVLADPGVFLAAIERAKGTEAVERPWFSEEIAGLRIGEVYFYCSRSKRSILIDLPGGKEDRSWRVEFGEEGCEGIGFDT